MCILSMASSEPNFLSIVLTTDEAEMELSIRIISTSSRKKIHTKSENVVSNKDFQLACGRYEAPVNTVQELTVRMNNAAESVRQNSDMLVRTQASMPRRAQAYIDNAGATRCYERWLQRWTEHLRQIRWTVGGANVPATRCSECLIQKVWYKRLSGLSRVEDIMEDADVAATTVAANFAFKSYGADKGIQT
jgi:hypothetical protein